MPPPLRLLLKWNINSMEYGREIVIGIILLYGESYGAGRPFPPGRVSLIEERIGKGIQCPIGKVLSK